MSDKITTNTSILPAQSSNISRTDKFFDTAEHIVERSEILLAKSKPAIISLFLLIHLVIDLIVVLIFVLKK